ncbi:MAG: DUF2782 domain-containing protein [Sedimenticola sp.]|jgi:hypothetical protein|nr:MAG: DUF2782 domain-containing protein [Sedimenticola sp.]
MKKQLCLAGLMLIASAGFAAENTAPEAVPEPPDLPPKVESGEVLEPEVRIIESEKGKLEEYSINGRVYMVKVTPQSGPPYYLVDSNGDGELDTRRDHPSEISVPQWVILSW